MKRPWKIALVAVAMVALAGTAVGFVAAQTDGEVPGKERFTNFVARLAENLSITQEELEEAIDQTQLDLVDEGVAEGRISEEKAAEIRQRIESGEAPLFPHRPQRPHRGAKVVAKVADFIGVTPEEVAQGLKDGQSLAQVAEAQGVSAEDLSAFLLGELEARLAEAVESGKITQERADEMLANAAERIDQLINREGLPERSKPPFGPHRFAPEGGFPGGLPEDGFPGVF